MRGGLESRGELRVNLRTSLSRAIFGIKLISLFFVLFPCILSYDLFFINPFLSLSLSLSPSTLLNPSTEIPILRDQKYFTSSPQTSTRSVLVAHCFFLLCSACKFTSTFFFLAIPIFLFISNLFVLRNFYSLFGCWENRGQKRKMKY